LPSLSSAAAQAAGSSEIDLTTINVRTGASVTRILESEDRAQETSPWSVGWNMADEFVPARCFPSESAFKDTSLQSENVEVDPSTPLGLRSSASNAGLQTCHVVPPTPGLQSLLNLTS
jgi:hypothetical protein